MLFATCRPEGFDQLRDEALGLAFARQAESGQVAAFLRPIVARYDRRRNWPLSLVSRSTRRRRCSRTP